MMECAGYPDKCKICPGADACFNPADEDTFPYEPEDDIEPTDEQLLSNHWSRRKVVKS